MSFGWERVPNRTLPGCYWKGTDFRMTGTVTNCPPPWYEMVGPRPVQVPQLPNCIIDQNRWSGCSATRCSESGTQTNRAINTPCNTGDNNQYPQLITRPCRAPPCTTNTRCHYRICSDPNADRWIPWGNASSRPYCQRWAETSTPCSERTEAQKAWATEWKMM